MTANDRPPEARGELREWLRGGDPLSDGTPNDADMRHLRARVLLAAGQRADEASRERFPVFRGLLAARTVQVLGAVAFLALAVASVQWLAPWSPSPTVSQLPARPAPVRQPFAPPAIGKTAPEKPREAQQVIARPTRHSALAARPSPKAAADRERKPLQIQFTTPGGTRIVWVLNPDLALRPLQQEE
jgi:hypothetical protein